MRSFLLKGIFFVLANVLCFWDQALGKVARIQNKNKDTTVDDQISLEGDMFLSNYHSLEMTVSHCNPALVENSVFVLSILHLL